MEKITKVVFLLTLSVALLSSPAWAEEAPGALDLSDCRVLSGEMHQAAFKNVMARMQRQASNNDLVARKGLAAVANNRFACHLDDLSEGAGWSVVTSPSAKDQDGGVESMSKQMVGTPVIINSPGTLQSLRAAFHATQALADEDVLYRNMAAGYVADYAGAFGKERALAYRDAIGVREVACRYPQAVPGRSAASLCVMAKSNAASLFTTQSADSRARLEAEAVAWADRYVHKASVDRDANGQR